MWNAIGFVLATAQLHAVDGINPIYGGISDFGYYFVDVRIGSPPQRLSAILDTGSEGLSLTCTTCRSCGDHHMDPFFNPAISSSFSRLSQCPAANLRNPDCIFEKRYLEGSVLKGKMYAEHISFANHNKNMTFGCIDSETRLFLDQKADGIMGLAPLPKTHWLYSAPNPVMGFSICLNSSGGDLQFHGPDIGGPDNTSIGLAYKEGHYVIEPMEVRVGANWTSAGQQSAIDTYLGNQVLIDSGSTITYLKDSLFQIVLTQIRAALVPHNQAFVEVPGGTSLCWRSNAGYPAHLAKLVPVITLVFSPKNGTSVIPIRFANYATSETIDATDIKSCLTIASNAGLARTDLGASWMLGKKVTLTSAAGWASVVETPCTERLIGSRPPVVPVEGQLTVGIGEDPSGLPVWGVIGLVAGIGLCLVLMVKRSIAPPVIHYEVVAPDDDN